MIRVQNKAVSKIVPNCRENVVFKMADTMREMAFAGETVSLDTLAQHGFTHDIVDKFGARAVALARRLSVKRVDGHA